MGPLPSIPVTLADGVERQFRLSFGAMRRLRDNHKIDIMKVADSLDSQPIETLASIIYEGLVDRTATREEIEDLCDFRLMPHLVQVLGDSMRNPAEKANPTPAAPDAETAQPSLISGQLPDTTSDSAIPISGS